jgi:RNA polymerase sigma factor (sigma-70 family)
MTKLTHDELAAAREQGNWEALWEAAMPLVHMTVRRMKRKGQVADEEADEDLTQECMAQAGAFMRTWDPLICAFSTYIVNNVRRQATRYLAVRSGGGIGSYKQAPVVLSIYDQRPNAAVEDEDEDDGTFAAMLTYQGVAMPGGQYDGEGDAPEGFGDPSEEADRGQSEAAARSAVNSLANPRERAAVRAVFGFDFQQLSAESYAEKLNIERRTVDRWVASAKKKMSKKLANFAY